MAKIRVHEFAKEMGMPSKQMVETLINLGLEVKNHMSTIEDSQVAWVRKRLSPEPEPAVDKIPAKHPDRVAASPERPPARQGGQKRPGAPEPPKPSQPAQAGPSIQPTKQKPSVPPPRQPERRDAKGETDQRSASVRSGRPAEPPTRSQDSARPAQPTSQADRPVTPRPGQAPRTGQAPPAGMNRPRPAGPHETRPAPSGYQDRRPSPQQGTGARPYGGQDRRPGTQQGTGARPYGGQDRRPAPQQGNAQRPAGGGAPRPQDRRPPTGAGMPGKKPFGGEVKKGIDNRGPQGAARPQGEVGRKPSPGKTAKKTLPQKQQPGSRDYSRPMRKGKHKKKKEEQVFQTPDKILVGDFIQVRELAEMTGKGTGEIVKKLMELGIMATINQEIDFETVEILGSLLDIEVERELSEEQQILEEIVDTPESLVPRPPIVTVMGHVDHGKTSLLDKIRHADVVSSEAGGITQHIGAYQIKMDKGKSITFIDTPGHEAFTAMRARGANLTDIVVLVVAADDGVMPQTVEAINHIRAAKVPFLVALNKMDKPDVNPDKVMQQLTEYNIVPEEWGGDTMFIPVSAKTGMGIENLLEMTALLAEMQELKANPNRAAEGVVIEAQLDKGKGAVATVLVQKGTLKIGDFIVCGLTWCKVRAMTDFRGRRVDLAYPSMPVEITGWSDVPEVGEKVLVTDEKIAKEIAGLRLNEKKLEDQKASSRISLDDFYKQMQNTGIKELNLIIKGDVGGSIEALAQSLLRLSTNEVKVNVIHSAVGAVTETDVMLASASNAIIIGFNVRPDIKARKYGEEENIDIRMYRVIYEAIDDVKKAMEGLLEPEYREKYLGRAEVRQTFKVPVVGTVAGAYIIDGKMQRNADIRVLRDSVIIHEGKLSSLKRFKDDVKEVVEGYECGMGVKDFNDIKEGDIIEAYTMEEIARSL
ncbi:MAG TPA: translation initiation factor IF-2 [Syntrophomonadaceae bacterium]|nr:translation initiation factor IF-2 [Syntrophomonadaceae bacterium]